MRLLGITLATLVVGAACGGEAAPAAAPEEVVASWLAAFDGAGDPGDYVVEGQASLLAAVEQSATAADIVASGLSDESAAAYWASFADGVAAVSGARPSALTVGEVVVLVVDDIDYAFVTVDGTGGSTVVVVRGTADGLIDLVATTGPQLVRPLRSLVDSLEEGAIDGSALAASLRAGLSDPGLDLPAEFYGEVQDLIAVLESS